MKKTTEQAEEFRGSPPIYQGLIEGMAATSLAMLFVEGELPRPESKVVRGVIAAVVVGLGGVAGKIGYDKAKNALDQFKENQQVIAEQQRIISEAESQGFVYTSPVAEKNMAG